MHLLRRPRRMVVPFIVAITAHVAVLVVVARAPQTSRPHATGLHEGIALRFVVDNGRRAPSQAPLAPTVRERAHVENPKRPDDEPPVVVDVAPPAIEDDAPFVMSVPVPGRFDDDNAPALVPPRPVVHRVAVSRGSAMEQVVLGYTPLPSDGVIASVLQDAPSGVDADDEESRVRARVNEIATVKSRAPTGQITKAVLVAVDGGGFAFRDVNTGMEIPQTPPAAGSVMLTMGKDGVFRDQDRPLASSTRRPDLRPADDGGYDYAPEGGGYGAHIFPDGTVSFEENLLSASFKEGPAIYEKWGIPARDFSSGTFSATDALYRMAGIDPYGASKTCFLDDVSDIRDELRAAHGERTMATGIGALRAHLTAIWRDDEHSDVERRRAIFNVWDQCVDESKGQVARAVILTFVRAHLPEGSPRAYTAEEIQDLNARRTSGPRFLPYGG